jgi:hypothetical protein
VRHLIVDEVPYSGATLAEVLCARRVLSLSITTPSDIASEPLTLPPRASADDLLVTSLTIKLDKQNADYVAAIAIKAFSSLTALNLSLPRTPVGSELLKKLCSTLQSPRAPALETLILSHPDLKKGCATQLATALLLRSSQSLTDLRLCGYIGTDADAAEVVRALKPMRRLTSLSVHSYFGGHAASLTAAALGELLTGNDSQPLIAPLRIRVRR